MTQPSKKEPTSANPPAVDGFFKKLDIEFLIHELKDPLSVIETAVRMLLEKQNKYGPLTDRQVKTLKRALKGSKKARHLVGDLLEVGRSDAGCFYCQWFDARAVLGDVLLEALEETDSDLWETLQRAESEAQREIVLNRHGIALSLADRAGGLRLCQDETKFRQIVGNLIKNALRHRTRHLEIRVDCKDQQLVVDVIDDGPGIDKEYRELIFEQYTRLDACATQTRPGHGLGLTGARALARRLGGEITVKDNRGRGAVFCLLLPMTFEA